MGTHVVQSYVPSSLMMGSECWLLLVIIIIAIMTVFSPGILMDGENIGRSRTQS